MKYALISLTLMLLLAACGEPDPVLERRTLADDSTVFQGDWTGEVASLPEAVPISFSNLIVTCPDATSECESYEFSGDITFFDNPTVTVSGDGYRYRTLYVQTSPPTPLSSVYGRFTLGEEVWTFAASNEIEFENEIVEYRGSIGNGPDSYSFTLRPVNSAE